MGESLVYAIKIALAVAATMAFVTAIITLVGLLIAFVANSMLGEIIGLISVFMPFNPAFVFGSVLSVMNAIIAFLIARKIWDITGATYKMS